jgi:hypothetical protein
LNWRFPKRIGGPQYYLPFEHLFHIKVQVLLQAEVNHLTSVADMVVAACSDGIHFYTAVDGGSILKYPINVYNLTQTTDEVLMPKQ